MAKIPGFRARFDYWKQKASKIVPQYFPVGTAASRAAVARWIPRNEFGDFPAVEPARDLPDTPGAKIVPDLEGAPHWHINPEAIRQWMEPGREEIPTRGRREEHWEKVTGVPITAWSAADDAVFQRAVRQVAKEITTWAELVERGKRGVIELVIDGKTRVGGAQRPDHHRADDVAVAAATAAVRAGGGTVRARPAGVNRRKDPALPVWPGSTLQFEVPVALPGEANRHRRAWLISQYSTELYVLDPRRDKDGVVASTRVDGRALRPHGEASRLLLPRGEYDYAEQSPDAPIGQEYDLVVVLMNLTDLDDTLPAQLDALEQRLAADVDLMHTVPSQMSIRNALEEAAALFESYDVPVWIYRDTCRVVPKPQQPPG